jgi:hypothetical protein
MGRMGILTNYDEFSAGIKRLTCSFGYPVFQFGETFVRSFAPVVHSLG